MSNSLFNQYVGTPDRSIIESFRRFQKSMQGRDPHEEINKLLQSGRINQQQLNQAQQMAQQMRGLFGGK